MCVIVERDHKPNNQLEFKVTQSGRFPTNIYILVGKKNLLERKSNASSIRLLSDRAMDLGQFQERVEQQLQPILLKS
jgi:hypothetical protein